MLQRFVNSTLVLTVSAVKVVLNTIIRAARQLFCDVRPLIAKLLMQVKYLFFFFLINRVFFNIGVQMIMPPKALVDLLLTSLDITFQCGQRFYTAPSIFGQQKSNVLFHRLPQVLQ
jgi:hypothetical protein